MKNFSKDDDLRYDVSILKAVCHGIVTGHGLVGVRAIFDALHDVFDEHPELGLDVRIADDTPITEREVN